MNTLLVTTTNDSGKGSLRQAIEDAKSGDLIKFSGSLANKTISLNKELAIKAGKNLIIDGKSASNLTISGSNKTRIFNLNSNQDFPTDLTVKNLTLANGFTKDRGGAISTTHKGDVNVENVVFRNNAANLGGGAVFTAYEGNLIVKKSRFESNKATAGNDERGGGAIAFWGPNNLTVTDSYFLGNQGINGGAINSLNGKMTIKNSQFINNKTTAAYYATGKKEGFLRGYGGAIFADRASASNSANGGAIDISNSTFKNNQGKGEGGAAYLFTGGKDRVNVARTIFEGNKISALGNGGNGGNGGGLVVMSNEVNRGLNITDSSFVKNTAAGQGGGMWMMNAPTKINNSTFANNRVESLAKSGVGGAMALYGKTDIVDTTIANNYAGWVGGGISANDKSVSVKNTIFYKNTATNGTNKWGIQQHTNRLLTDYGNNIQYPPKQTKNYNDYNATANIKIVDPELGSMRNVNGMMVYTIASGSPATGHGSSASKATTASIASASTTNTDTNANNVTLGAATPTDTATDNNNTTIAGTVYNDNLDGGAGNDAIVGGKGSDVLTGGSGIDRFVFDVLKQGVDRITDFVSADDTLEISAGAFGGGLKPETLLAASQFVLGSSATDADDRFLYSKNNGMLFFDSDGTGSSAKIHIATFTNQASLSNADFEIKA
jgi:Ca2+-binding RTX toxin-like protein